MSDKAPLIEPREGSERGYRFWLPIVITISLAVIGMMHIDRITERIIKELRCLVRPTQCSDSAPPRLRAPPYITIRIDDDDQRR